LAEGAAAALLQPKLKTWMPACAGMTERPRAGMTERLCAGMTERLRTGITAAVAARE
jgi:hypothetical protein